MNDLLSRLKNSGLIKHASDGNVDNAAKILRLEETFNGEWIINDVGSVFVIEDLIPYQSSHGQVKFVEDIDNDFLQDLFNNPQKALVLSGDMVFLDIETSSLSFGAGSFVFLIGLCYFADDGLHTKLLLIDSPGNEPALLLLTEQFLSDSKVLCTYNGKSFDLPFIRNRFRFHRIPYSLDTNTHIDLLHTTRRLWKKRLVTCKLSEIEKEILLFTRDSEEIPGWLVPQIYYDFLSSRDAASLKGVVYHNKMDVISLAALVILLSLYSTKKPEKHADEQDYFSLAELFIKNGDFQLAKEYYEKGFALNDKSKISSIIFRRYGFLLKRLHVFAEANKYWETAASSGDHIACIELAKYFEHHDKKYPEALKWAEQARNNLINAEKYDDHTQISAEIDHRINRIQRKLKDHEKQKV